MAGHMSAPLGLEWFPPSLEKQLNRMDLGKMMIDPACFPNALVGPKVLVPTEWR